MKRHLAVLAMAGVFGSFALAQQPSVLAGGIVNNASYTPSALPGSAIAQGSIFVVFGNNMGPATLQTAGGSYPLPTTLGGTTVKITSGSTTANAVLFYSSAGQLGALLPSTIAAGPASLTVTYNGQTSAPANFQVATSSFGAFTSNNGGSGPGAVTDAGNNLNTLTNAATAGETVVLYGTGLGPVSGNEAAGPLPGDLTNVPVEVYVGTTKAVVSYRGRSGCCAALDQINFIVPAGLTGCRVPVAVKIGNNVSNFSTVSLAAAGSRICSDAGGPSTSDLQKFSQQGFTAGGVVLSRIAASITVPGFGSVDASNDVGSAGFYKYTPAMLNTAQNPFNTTTTGACSVSFYKGGTAAGDPVLPKSLDAGTSINVTGPAGSKAMARTTFGPLTSYSAVFGGNTSLPGIPPTPGFLDPGSYTVTGPGGADIGAFTSTMVLPPSLKWTNQASINTVTRSQGQLITWTGGDPAGSVQIAGTSATGTDANAYTSTFTCTAKTSDGQFTIPALVLLSLPPSIVVSTVPTGALLVGTVSAPKTFAATGLDTGVFVSSTQNLKTLNYQ